ncbi:MAG: phosphate regulon sensor histidine kinase PhoR [Betaproteobacteria bacterium]|nr:phosphate regulon sensor histidine kinase PhoR [Betaproteobacteria bacterium]
MFFVIAVSIVAGLTSWFFFSAFWAIVVVVLVLSLFTAHHFYQLTRLMRWLRQPVGTPLPKGGGAWEDVFAELHRRSREAAEERNSMKTALERFRHAGQALPDGVVILDSNQVIEWFNTTAEHHFGLSRDKDVGSRITNLLREPTFVSYIGAGQYADPLLLHPVRESGRTLALQIVSYGDAQSLLLSRDITQLEKLETMRRDFVANVSHELKTPLTVVSGFIETLLDDLSDLSEEEAKHFLGLAHEQAQRMQRLIMDLLMLSALETGSPPPTEERVALDDLLAEVTDEAMTLSKGRHQIVPTGTNGAGLLGSRNELRSALGNLVTNAIRYTPAGGTIRISWQTDDDGSGVFSVSDNGIGIENHHLPRLTERFYRVDRGRSRESGGTGLGLAIVKHVLTRHQAVLKIQSELSHGSTFSAQFPAHRVTHGAISKTS